MEEGLVGVGDGGPGVALADPVDGLLLPGGTLRCRHIKSALHDGGERLGGEGQADASGYLGVLRSLQVQNQRAPAHRFDERGVGAADFGGVDVGVAV